MTGEITMVTSEESEIKKNSEQRVRQYAKNHKGPFEVIIRPDKEPIKQLQLSKYIFKKYNGKIIACQSVNTDKVRIVCNDGLTANEIPSDKNLCTKYRVYIPEIYVEILGLINVSVFENEKDIVLFGEGKWKNPGIPTVKVLDVYRYTKKSENSNENTKTELVRVAFPGSVLPDYVNVEGLLIKVKEFHRRQMFCEKCMSYSHTSKYCVNKPKCKFCGSTQHNEESCDHKNINKCLDCDGEHLPGAAECPKRRFLQKKTMQRARIIKKKSYAEILNELVDNPRMPGEMDDDEVYEDIPSTSSYKPGSKREFPKLKSKTNMPQSPIKKRPKFQENPKEIGPKTRPAGYKKDEDESEDYIYTFLESLIAKLDVSPFIKDLISQFVLPIVMKIISSVKNAFSSSLLTGLLRNGL